jgi:hypothetical protein
VVQFFKAKSNKQDFAYATINRHVNKWIWEVKVDDVDRSKSWEFEQCVN